MNPVLQNIMETGRVKTPAGVSIELHSQISPEEGDFLQQVITLTRPSISLEVGLAYGISSLYICEALTKIGAKRHIAIDPHQFGIPEHELVDLTNLKDGWQGVGMNNLKEAGYGSLIELCNTTSDVALPRLMAEGLKIDFALIDGWHTFDYAMIDFFFIDKMLRPGGVIVVDDANVPPVRKLCRYIVTNRAYSVFSPGTTGGATPSRGGQSLLFKMPGVSQALTRIVKPKFSEPDTQLGFPNTSYIAFQKNGDDLLGDGPGARGWAFHHDF